jgi:hypothetical protein
MKALPLILTSSLMTVSPAWADTEPVSVGPNGSVVQVNVDGKHVGSGVVIDRSGTVLTAAYVVEGCEEHACAITVTDGASGAKPAKAAVTAIDYRAGLAVISAERTFSAAAVLEDLGAIGTPKDVVAVIGVRRNDGKDADFSDIIEPRLSGPSNGFPCRNCMVIDHPGGQRMGGAGVFSVPAGRLVGILFTPHRIENGVEIRYCTLAIPADAIRTFLKAKGVTFQDAKQPLKTK